MKVYDENETSGSGEGTMPEPLSMFEKLAEKIGVTARAATIYGEAVECDGVTVIPVAKARWGLGGGGGHRRHGANEGLGGGGGITVNPVGYIEIREGRSRFRPIWDPAKVIGLGAAGGFLLLLAVRGFRRCRGE
ncbi:MAG TPA: spore germination protein GerW family protein [Thermoanaerobaculia bacterium]|jgi:uncharacterized spore protein YtfJ|nr:spore germination protein GerW family protein [Thermoanaerobaculia bacterium]